MKYHAWILAGLIILIVGCEKEVGGMPEPISYCAGINMGTHVNEEHGFCYCSTDGDRTNNPSSHNFSVGQGADFSFENKRVMAQIDDKWYCQCNMNRTEQEYVQEMGDCNIPARLIDDWNDTLVFNETIEKVWGY